MDARQEYSPSSRGGEQPILCLMREFTSDAPHCRMRPQLHFHEHIELLYGRSGTASVLIGSRTLPLAPGDLVIIDAREAHEVICEAGRVRYDVIKFLPEILFSQSPAMIDTRLFLPIWRRHFDRHPRIGADALRPGGIGALIGEIMHEWGEKAQGYEALLCADIMKLFISTLRLCCPASTAAEPLPDSLRRALAAALDAAQKNPVGISARDAAAACGLSYSYFSRSFKTAFGISFTAYAESLRMREAERLLLTTEREITDIAAALGFATTSYFIERFRLRTGFTPGNFRRAAAGGNKTGGGSV